MRESGFYWVKYRGEWIVFYYNHTHDYGIWIGLGTEYRYTEAEFEEIDERRIERVK